MRAVLLGGPGAGKGVYAQYFSEKYCIPQISTGEIFRQEIARNSELGFIVKPYVEQGLLVPDEIVVSVIKRRLEDPSTTRGFILDGFPRTLNQAKALDEFASVDVAIHLLVSEEVAVKRLSGRLTCPICGRVYNIYYEPKPRENEKCDYDGAKLVRRKDDEPEVIIKRYRVFYQSIAPIIDYYLSSRRLIEVNADKPYREVIPLLERLLVENRILKLKPCRDLNLG